jgi:hypothetical protein
MIQDLEDTFAHSVTNSKFRVFCKHIFRHTVLYINTFKNIFNFICHVQVKTNIFCLHIYFCLWMFKR